ncbi:3119_t:CDS:2 [Dentiscutata heterogama]|uniref:3119_t:CDS:1 n=1 Tax=Dentiscutata heterogama TaxID=1316150 RepID=A0ACA9L3Y1_9GLOM|nr:3119_t:CDS:2 [Dentiscutata heterogama]
MNPDSNKRHTAKSINATIIFWNEEIASFDDENEIKKQFLKADKTVNAPHKSDDMEDNGKYVSVNDLSFEISKSVWDTCKII